MLSISFFNPAPAWKRVSVFFSQSVPSRHGNAPAAAFMLVELDGAQRELHDAGRVVEHHHAAGSKHRSGFRHRVEIHGDIDFPGQQDRR